VATVLLEKERRRKQMTKPRCKLIGEDGNIFNLMGIASRTLKKAGMKDKADEMVDKITKSKSYDEALSIIMEYVEID
jgi:glutamate mutase epsilon subunit